MSIKKQTECGALARSDHLVVIWGLHFSNSGSFGLGCSFSRKKFQQTFEEQMNPDD
jgi:hypothetical protein